MNMFINFPVVWFMFKYRNLHVNSKGTKMHSRRFRLCTNLKQKVNIGRRWSGLVDNMDNSLDFTAT